MTQSHEDEDVPTFEAEVVEAPYAMSTYDSGWQAPPFGRTQPRRMAWATACGVTAIAAAIVAGLSVVLETASAGTIMLHTEPPDAVVMLDGARVPGHSPFTVRGVEARRVHVLRVVHRGYEDWSGRVRLHAGQTMSLPAVALSTIETGVAVRSKPSGARVIVDGQDTAKLTPVRLVNLSTGTHTIKLVRPGYHPWASAAVHLTVGVVLPLPEVELTPLSRPISERKVSAAEKDTPSTASRLLTSSAGASSPIGSPEPALSTSRLPPHSETGRMRDDGALSTLGAASRSIVGFLRVNSLPWSMVVVDGRTIGTTPQMKIPLAAGAHDVTLVNVTFGIHERLQVDIPAGKTVTKVIRFDR